jgi:SAM-dependent methyltransferase
VISRVLHRLHQLPYLVHGLIRRIGQAPACPCGRRRGDPAVARKGFHTLHACGTCGLLYRHPRESADEMASFYQEGYAEPGLTTELPSAGELDALLRTGFVGSGKDFSWHITRLAALGIRPGARLLDYGANWGYATWQFRKAGYETLGFEVSRPRAAFAERLGVRVETDPDAVEGAFDAVFSSHVIEHVREPAAALEWQYSRLAPGGLIVAFTPHGTDAYRRRDPRGWQSSWGQVHPVLLTRRFAEAVVGERPCLVTTDTSLEQLARWDGRSQAFHPCDGAGLLLVIRRPA